MKLVFIWHMHQPFYKDLSSGEYLMPWVRLHGAKDYLDMLLILDEFPELKQTFNLVPALLDQIVDYAEGGAVDRHLQLSRKPAAELRDNERLEVIDTFFTAHHPTMVKPYPRYAELFNRRRDTSPRSRLQSFSEQDLRDLQFWSNATWIDPMFRSEPAIARMYRKGRDFTEEEKQLILDHQNAILRRIIPAYQERARTGQIEVALSPYYHPILPLLIDTDSARMAVPNMELPRRRFAHPEDAETQIAGSRELYRQLFGDAAPGMWPSEGSVSEAVLPLLAKHGFQWIATDEEVFYASLNLIERGGLLRPELGNGFHRRFTVGADGQKIGILFRDHALSDKIGFVYSSWDAERAAEDFVSSLRELGKLYAGRNEEPVVTVILDGENAWEYYPNDGHDFLRALYQHILQEPGITTTTPRELFSDSSPSEHLPHLFSGSWINHNFRVWIGHAEDNAAWDLLSVTRDKLVEIESSGSLPPDRAAFCWKEIHIAEGSDWCWWYGDDHQTEHFQIFDRLFRRHLQNVWDALGIEPPLALMRPIRRLTRQAGLHEPTDFIHPAIDGRQTSFFEWFGSGRVECGKLGGAMHRIDTRVYQIMYGFDDRYLYFRIDFEKNRSLADTVIQIELAGKDKLNCLLDHEVATLSRPDSESAITGKIAARWDQILELGIPRDLITTSDDKHLYFAVAVLECQKLVERWPEANYISLELPDPGQSHFWQV